MGNNDLEFWSLFLILMFTGWVATTWIRAKHGYPVEDTMGGKTWHPNQDKQRAEDAEKIRQLEERIQVLEKIIIDKYKADDLSEEIDKLKGAG